MGRTKAKQIGRKIAKCIGRNIARCIPRKIARQLYRKIGTDRQLINRERDIQKDSWIAISQKDKELCFTRLRTDFKSLI